MQAFVRYLVRARKAKKLTQRSLAARAGIDYNKISAIEAGRVTHAPTIETLDELALALDVDVHFLIDIVRGKIPIADDGTVIEDRLAKAKAAQAGAIAQFPTGGRGRTRGNYTADDFKNARKGGPIAGGEGAEGEHGDEP